MPFPKGGKATNTQPNSQEKKSGAAAGAKSNRMDPNKIFTV